MVVGTGRRGLVGLRRVRTRLSGPRFLGFRHPDNSQLVPLRLVWEYGRTIHSNADLEERRQ